MSANFVKTTVAASVSIGATSITIAVPGAPWNEPENAAGSLTLVDSANNPTKLEIITFTGYSGGVLSGVLKGQEGTADQAWDIGSTIYGAITYGQMDAKSDVGHTHAHGELTGVVANEHIDWTVDQGATNIHTGNYINTTYVSSDFDHDSLTGFVANEHIDWTVDQGATNIHANNYTNTTYVSSDFDHDSLTGFVANEHIDWTAASAGTIHPTNYTDTTYSAYAGTTAGLVPTGLNSTTKYLREDGTWVVPPDTDTTYTSSDFNHDSLTGFVANEHIDWTTDQGATNIHANNYTDTTYSNATTSVSGLMSATDKTKLDGVATSANNYSLPQATSSVRGGVELASDTVQTVAANTVSATASRTYGVQLNAANQMVVNVPWEDTNTTYTSSSFDHDSLTGFVANEHIDWTTDQGATNIHAGNYTNTTYSNATTSVAGLMSSTDKTKLDGVAASANNYALPLAANGTRGGVQIGYTENGKNYPVELSTEKMFVNVPWTDTVYTHPSDGGGNQTTLTGATVYSDITINTAGHVTATSTRDLTAADVGAAATGHTHSYLPLAGGTVTGVTSFTSTTDSTSTTTGAIKTSGGIGVAGSVYAGGNVTAYSDLRLKTNIKRIPNALHKVSQLGGYTYDRVDMDLRQTGVIAQEVLDVLPEAVQGSGDGLYSVNYGSMVGLLIQAIKELNGKVDALQAELEAK